MKYPEAYDFLAPLPQGEWMWKDFTKDSARKIAVYLCDLDNDFVKNNPQISNDSLLLRMPLSYEHYNTFYFDSVRRLVGFDSIKNVYNDTAIVQLADNQSIVCTYKIKRKQIYEIRSPLQTIFIKYSKKKYPKKYVYIDEREKHVGKITTQQKEWGLIIKRKNGNRAWTWLYDKEGQLISSTSSADGKITRKTEYSYSWIGNQKYFGGSFTFSYEQGVQELVDARINLYEIHGKQRSISKMFIFDNGVTPFFTKVSVLYDERGRLKYLINRLFFNDNILWGASIIKYEYE